MEFFVDYISPERFAALADVSVFPNRNFLRENSYIPYKHAIFENEPVNFDMNARIFLVKTESDANSEESRRHS